MRKLILFFVTLSMFCGLALPTPTNASEQNLTIAIQGPFTGSDAAFGQSQRNAVQFAISHFNEVFKGQYKVSLNVIDDQGDPSISQTIAPSVAKDNRIIGLIGPSYSGAAREALPVYNKTLLPTISPSATSPLLTNTSKDSVVMNPVFHRVVSNWNAQILALVKNATEGVSKPRIFAVVDGSDLGKEIINTVKHTATNGVEVNVATVGDGAKDWTNIIAQIKAAAANVVIAGGYNFNNGTLADDKNLLKQLRKSGYSGIFATSAEFVYDVHNQSTSLLSIPDGVRLTFLAAPLGLINTKFAEYFAKFTGRASQFLDAEAIDAANVFLYCISKGVTTRPQMLNCVDTFDGASIYGTNFSFNPNGEMNPSRFHSFETISGIKYFKTSYNQSQLTAQQVIEQFPWYPKSQGKAQDTTQRKGGGKKELVNAESTIYCVKITNIKGYRVVTVTTIKPECPKGYKLGSNLTPLTFLACWVKLDLIEKQLLNISSYYKSSEDLWNDQNLLYTFIKKNQVPVAVVKDRFIQQASEQLVTLESIWSKYDYADKLLTDCKKAEQYPRWLEIGRTVISLKNSFIKNLIPLITANNMKYFGNAISEIEEQNKSWDDPAIFQEQVEHFYMKYVTSILEEMKRRDIRYKFSANPPKKPVWVNSKDGSNAKTMDSFLLEIGNWYEVEGKIFADTIEQDDLRNISRWVKEKILGARNYMNRVVEAKFGLGGTYTFLKAFPEPPPTLLINPNSKEMLEYEESITDWYRFEIKNITENNFYKLAGSDDSKICRDNLAKVSSLTGRFDSQMKYLREVWSSKERLDKELNLKKISLVSYRISIDQEVQKPYLSDLYDLAPEILPLVKVNCYKSEDTAIMWRDMNTNIEKEIVKLREFLAYLTLSFDKYRYTGSNSLGKKSTIICSKGGLTKKITAANPKCPDGYKKM
jgi:branched-chain amino acid transport system substrate-binding protein